MESPRSATCVSEERFGTAGVILRANFEGESGFALENRALAQRLARHDFPVQVVPIDSEPTRGGTRHVANGHLKNLLHDRLNLAESVLYQSGAPTSWNLDFYGRCRVGRATFGADRIPDGWAERCNALDELWVPTEFHRESFTASGVERNKIFVLPQAVDSEVFCPGKRPLQIAPAKSFRFLAIADGMLASGVDVLVRAFIEEFAPDEDVALILHCPSERQFDSHADFEAEIIAFIETKLTRKLEDIPPITLILGSLSEQDRPGLFAASNAFVQPARAEATGHSCLEALAFQLPVIATDWGPLSDFLTDRNGFPLTSRGLASAQPEENELFDDRLWAEPDLDHLRHRMREVFANPNEAVQRAEQGRRDVVNRFDWNALLPEWIRNFRRLLS